MHPFDHKLEEPFEEPEELPEESPELPPEEPPQEPAEQEKPAVPPTPPLAEKFLKTRTILIFGEINQRLAQTVTQQLLMMATDFGRGYQDLHQFTGRARRIGRHDLRYDPLCQA